MSPTQPNSLEAETPIEAPTPKRIRRGRPTKKKTEDQQEVPSEPAVSEAKPAKEISSGFEKEQALLSFDPDEPNREEINQESTPSEREDRDEDGNERQMGNKNFRNKNKKNQQKKGKIFQNKGSSYSHQGQHQHQHPHQRQHHQSQQRHKNSKKYSSFSKDKNGVFLGNVFQLEVVSNSQLMGQIAQDLASSEDTFNFNECYEKPQLELQQLAEQSGIALDEAPRRRELLKQLLNQAFEQKKAIIVEGIVDSLDEDNAGLIVYTKDNYRPVAFSTLVPSLLMKKYGIKRGQQVKVQAQPPQNGHNCLVALKVIAIMDEEPELNTNRVPFRELIPYYPTERLLLEVDNDDAHWDNLSMRVIDLLTPIGLGQRGLIVAPPRTGKTILLQCIANAIATNRPDVHLIILLIDERPEEVTDFVRQIEGRGEIVSSTFDEPAENHVHVAEMVAEKARCLLEANKDVVILLDSITRLARAYNTVMPSSGKILSGGVEANALQGPKRIFGSARNIEEGGSLTILGTALVETGSRMDEVVFEEFKGTGNMEMHLDRSLSDKRIYPALNFERSGTRKEELLYHPDEMNKVHSLRRAMKGVPSNEAMEMLIQRVRKTPSNAAFLMSLNR